MKRILGQEVSQSNTPNTTTETFMKRGILVGGPPSPFGKEKSSMLKQGFLHLQMEQIEGSIWISPTSRFSILKWLLQNKRDPTMKLCLVASEGGSLKGTSSKQT